MKFICSVENGTTFVALDLKAIPSLPGEFDYMRTICMFRGTYHAFDFTIINEFLSRLDKITLKHIVSTLSNMRRCIANSGHDDPAADKCVGEISQYMKELVEYTPMYLTGNILKELYRYSKKFITENSRVSKSCSVIDREMFITASLLSALCVMVIHDFETHFTDVDEPLQVLYPVFEEAIKNSGIDGAKKFVEKCRTLMEDMNGDSASWVIEVIYINECMIRDHGPGLPIDVAVIENYTQRILSSKLHILNKRIKEMKEINKAEEQQRNDRAKSTINNGILLDTAIIAALIIKRAALSRGATYLSGNACNVYCDEIIKDVNKVIIEINDPNSSLSQRIMRYCDVSEIGNDISIISEIVNAVCTEINIYVNQGIDEKFDGYDEINNSTELFFIRGKFYLPPDLIINAIVDIISTTSILSSNSLRSYIPYNTLCERLQAFAMIVPKLNPEAGPAVTALIQSSSEINIGCLVSAIDSQNHI